LGHALNAVALVQPGRRRRPNGRLHRRRDHGGPVQAPQAVRPAAGAAQQALRRRRAAALGLLRRQALPRQQPHQAALEILLNITYSSGVWQFEGYNRGIRDAGVRPGRPPRNTTLMLHVYGGRLVYYNDETKVVDRHIYDWWFRLNLVHNIQASALTVFIDGDETLIVPGYGSDFHYFKFGVYTQTNPSHYMESRWRDLKVYTKTPY
ncbi:hypothetical protein CFC21_105372, partial [Triticum aestivum]